MRAIIAAVLSLFLMTTASADPLPSWNAGGAKQRIIAFVESVTNPTSADYVTHPARIAVFDNDGTLWAEKPVYFQLIFAVERVAAMAKDDPSILKSDAMKAAAAGDMEALAATGKEGLLEVVSAAHSGMTIAAFEQQVRDWLKTAKHPTKNRGYDTLVYQPMLELLSYLRDKGFKTYIVSGGGIDFIRAFAERAYNIPPEQVIGSSGKSSYQMVDGKPAVMKDPGIAFVDDKEGKPVAIASRIGRRPIFAGGNSDGDFQMLEWTTAGEGPRFGLLVHHTDGEREWAYDREGHVGVLKRGQDEAAERGWLLVDMKTDWNVIFPALP
jgi:phosphoglycolate phosphatase-like HAD superfamily hydrolase